MTHAIAYELNQQVSVSMHQHGAVFFHLGHGRLFTSNGTGARIWHGLEQQWSVESIAEDLSQEYGIALTSARSHTARFLAQLEDRQLIARRAA